MKISKQKLLNLNIVVDNEYLDKYIELINSNEDSVWQKYKSNKHHIIPRCYYKHCGLKVDNSKENLVNLLYKDHILAHYYLALCSKDNYFKYANINALRYIETKYSINIKEIIDNLDYYQELYEHLIKTNSELAKGRPAWNKGKPWSDETRKKMSISRTGKKRGPHSAATKQKMSDARKGIVYTKETRQKMSDAKKGNRLSEEQKQKISQKLKGQKKSWAGRKQSAEEIEKRRQKLIGHATSEETRKKISKANKGKKISDETRKKMSLAKIGREPWNKGKPSNIKNRKCIYNSITDTIKYINIEDLQIYLETGWVIGNPRLRKK